MQGRSEDIREAAALRFATAVVEKRGRIDEADFKMVTDAGSTCATISVTSSSTMNTSANHANPGDEQIGSITC
jgi:hypothetical protein